MGGFLRVVWLPDTIDNISLNFIEASNNTAQGSFLEHGLLQGTIRDDRKVTVTLQGDTFRRLGDVSGDIDVENIPSTLRHTARIINPSQMEVSLQGQVADHARKDSIHNIAIAFNNRFLFTSDVASKRVEGISLDFVESTPMSISGKFKETTRNDGSLGTKITLINDGSRYTRIADDQLHNYINIPNLPRGLTPKYERLNDSQITVELEGKSTAHKRVDNIDNLQINFTNVGLFANGIIGEPLQASLDFFDLSSIVATGEFKEIRNTGTYEGRLLVQIDGDEFDTTYVLGRNDVIVETLPAGITSTARFISKSALEIKLEGQTADHAVSDLLDASGNVKTLSVRFPNANIVTSGIAPPDIYNIKISNIDPSDLTLSGSFRESDEDIGAILSKITLELPTDQFDAGANLNNQISIDNLPQGLIPSYNLVNAQQLTVELRGRARLSHHIDSDITLNFNEDAFISKISANPVAVPLDFVKKPVLDTKGSLKESLQNDGTIATTLSLTINNGEVRATADPATQIDLQGLPAGLTPSYKIIDPHLITVALEGTAYRTKPTIASPTSLLRSIKISLSMASIVALIMSSWTLLTRRMWSLMGYSWKMPKMMGRLSRKSISPSLMTLSKMSISIATSISLTSPMA